MNKTPLLNITVPVFNRPELTRQTLLAARKNTPVDHCITVVDNGSDLETKEILVEMKRKGTIDHLFRLEKNYGVAVAANVGWRMIDSPLYMKLDNDIIIKSPKWFPLLLRHMKRHGKDAVWGGDFHCQLDKKAYVKKRDGFIGKCHLHISGGAIIIPKSISDVLGYWCEDYGLYGCEDGDYGVRMHVFGVDRFYFDHKLLMEHLGNDIEVMKTEYNLDKKSIQDMFRNLWRTNKFLYEARHRAPNIPPQFVPDHYDGYTLTLKENGKYKEMCEALMIFHKTRVEFNDELTQPVIEALNSFIGVQNRTWNEATQFANDSYATIKAQL